PFSFNGQEIITGFFKRKSHDVFQVEDNMLNSVLGNKIITELKNILNKNKVTVYDEKKHSGILRHVMVRTNSFNEAMLVLIINDTKVSEKIKSILKEVMDKFKEITSTYISLNDRKTNVALGYKNLLIFGEKTIKEDIDNIHFNISPTSFFQINLDQTKRLYSLAISMFENIENKKIVDAYAGTGTIGMILSKKAKKVYSIEIVESAVKDGIQTAKENNIENVQFICGDVNKELGKLIKAEKVDSIILDPPRKGIDEESLINISKVGIEEIVYISCNPSTFARDIEILEREGYKLVRVKPVDMFPQTSHIEVVGRLVKK
ncbi:MAG: 23S rRNA (uracil(1939)-C(5))-methyltransferase RlmD, partial [Cetobacterium sp.]